MELDLCTSGGYVQGEPTDYNRNVAVDVVQLLAFLQESQSTVVTALELENEGIRHYLMHRCNWVRLHQFNRGLPAGMLADA